MSAWVLILILYSNGNGTLAVTNVEFPTQEGCIEAGKKIKPEYQSSKWFCVEKK